MTGHVVVGLLGIGLTALSAGAASAQVATPATPIVGTPTRPAEPPPLHPAAPSNLPLLAPSGGPLPASLTLAQALSVGQAHVEALLGVDLLWLQVEQPPFEFGGRKRRSEQGREAVARGLLVGAGGLELGGRLRRG